MKKVSRQGIVGVVCVSLLVVIVAGCSTLPFNLGGRSDPTPASTPKPAPKATPKPVAPKPKTPDVTSIIDAGKSQRKAGNYSKAIVSFEKALAADSSNKEAAALLADTKKERDDLIEQHMKKGLQYFSDDNLQAALKEWENILSLNPAHAKALEYKERTQKQLDAFK